MLVFSADLKANEDTVYLVTLKDLSIEFTETTTLKDFKDSFSGKACGFENAEVKGFLSIFYNEGTIFESDSVYSTTQNHVGNLTTISPYGLEKHHGLDEDSGWFSGGLDEMAVLAIKLLIGTESIITMDNVNRNSIWNDINNVRKKNFTEEEWKEHRWISPLTYSASYTDGLSNHVFLFKSGKYSIIQAKEISLLRWDDNRSHIKFIFRNGFNLPTRFSIFCTFSENKLTTLTDLKEALPDSLEIKSYSLSTYKSFEYN